MGAPPAPTSSSCVSEVAGRAGRRQRYGAPANWICQKRPAVNVVPLLAKLQPLTRPMTDDSICCVATASGALAGDADRGQVAPTGNLKLSD